MTDYTKLSENELSEIVIGCAIEVHKLLGPGLLESAYQTCLYYELIKLGMKVEKEKILPLNYKDVKIECGYRIDMLVEDKLILELKSCESLSDIHKAQLLTYLKLTNCKLGLLINFNVLLLKNGIKRVANNL
jgi:GxxExxY protein